MTELLEEPEGAFAPLNRLIRRWPESLVHQGGVLGQHPSVAWHPPMLCLNP